MWECDTELDGLIPWDDEEPVVEVEPKEGEQRQGMRTIENDVTFFLLVDSTAVALRSKCFTGVLVVILQKGRFCSSDLGSESLFTWFLLLCRTIRASLSFSQKLVMFKKCCA